jgi:hypothetical protein
VKVAVPVAGDDVWKRGDKYARGAIAAEELAQIVVKAPASSAPPAVSAEVPVKARTAAVDKPLLPETVTIEGLVAEFRRAQRLTTQRILLLGALCERWIRQQLEKGTALDRATAVKRIREELAAAKLEKKEARVDLYVRCYWVATLLSGWKEDSQESRAAANELAFSALRLFPVLVERDRATDRWQLIGRYAEAGQALWGRAIAEKLSAKTVDVELSKILPARTVSIRKHRPIRLSVIEKLLARLKPEDLPKVHGLVDQASAKLSSTAAA